MNITTATRSLFTTLAIAAAIAAQNTTATATVDQGDLGCQGPNGLITGGVAVSADITVNYDASNAIMQLVVENTTPIVAGESTATITQVHINVPPGAITNATLVGQNGSGGAAPAFTLSFDDDVLVAPNPNSTACQGNHNICLDAGNGAHGAIANAAASSVSTPAPVLGPVTFDIQLAGPGANSIDAETILASFSAGGANTTNVTLKFQGGGVGGQESGFVGSREECRTAVYAVGDRTPGSTFDICVTGDFGCHVCLWVSAVPGPVTVAGFEIPIGLPLLGAYGLGNLGLNGNTNRICLPVAVPNVPGLSGYTLYLTNITYNALNVQGFSFAPAFTLTID